jgi:hypothetical protein
MISERRILWKQQEAWRAIASLPNCIYLNAFISLTTKTTIARAMMRELMAIE